MDKNMKNYVYVKLEESLLNLENAINKAKIAIYNRRGANDPIYRRLVSYEPILMQQKDLSKQLKQCIQNENCEEVWTIVKRINALSEMIKDDARMLVYEISTGNIPDSDEMIH